MLQVGAVLSESGERGLLPPLQPVADELEASESVTDVLACEYRSEQMLVGRIEIFSIDANASASRPDQPGHVTPAFAHCKKSKQQQLTRKQNALLMLQLHTLLDPAQIAQSEVRKYGNEQVNVQVLNDCHL